MAARNTAPSGRGGRSSPARRAPAGKAELGLRAESHRRAGSRAARRAIGRAGGPPRHGIPELQRARMLHAMAQVCHDRGAVPATVSEVCGHSRVSRRTFYEMFVDKEDCFLAALQEATERVASRVIPAYERQDRWVDAIRGGLHQLLAFLDEDPVFAHLLIVQSLAAGPAALRLRAETLGPVVLAIDRGQYAGRASQSVSRITAEGVVNAVLGILHERLEAGSSRPLASMLGELMCIVVLPYLGPAAAHRELERPLPEIPRGRAAEHKDALAALKVRLTYRTIRVLQAIATAPGASNREVASIADIVDQGQASKLLARLARAGAIRNDGAGSPAGEPNSWHLTELGAAVAAEVGGAMH